MILRLFSYFKSRLNTWDEICSNESARLRTNTIICTLSITCIFALMFIVCLTAAESEMMLLMVVLGAISGTLCYLQLKSDIYRLAVALCFGVMAMCMSIYFLYYGGGSGLNFIWLYIVPSVAVMVVSIPHSLLYNGVFIGLIGALLLTPARDSLAYQYSPEFNVLFPVSLCFVTLCIYIAEIIRYKTHRRLVETSKQLKAQAYMDPLTGTYNRRAFYDHFETEGAEGNVFALLDLDFFKSVNDRYGHSVGDQMLLHIVGLIDSRMDGGSRLYRWGGEEFLLVMDADGSRTRMEGICELVRNSPLICAGKHIPMSISIGAYTALGEETLDECIMRADRRLYIAKSNGRDQLVFSDTPPAAQA